MDCKINCFQFSAEMKNENDLTFSFFIFQVLRKINWHSGTRILKLPYWSYGQFDLDLLTDDECTLEFYRNSALLAEVLQIPDQIRCYNRTRVIVNGIEALLIFLKRSAYPCRYSDMLTSFCKIISSMLTER